MNILENKRQQFIARVKLTRGDGEDTKKEIQGGRTACRISEIRVADDSGVDPAIKNAIGDFIQAAQGGDTAKNAAVDGATALLSSGLDGLFGASSGGGMEKEGFVVIFLNFAFVRIDYLVYSYNVSGSKWGSVANESGSCYVADIAILDPSNNTDVRGYEIDYLLAQSLSVSKDSDRFAEFNAISQMKCQLAQSAILSRLLQNEELTLTDMKDITSELADVNQAIASAFGSLSDYEPYDPKYNKGTLTSDEAKKEFDAATDAATAAKKVYDQAVKRDEAQKVYDDTMATPTPTPPQTP